MPSRFESPESPKPPEPADGFIDTTKRYDVYCSHWQQQGIVYRDVLLKRPIRLFDGGQYDLLNLFIEIEQADGQTAFIQRHGIVRICAPGAELRAEIINPK